MCPDGRPVGMSAKGRKRPVDVPGGRLAGWAGEMGPEEVQVFSSLTSSRGRLIELRCPLARG